MMRLAILVVAMAAIVGSTLGFQVGEAPYSTSRVTVTLLTLSEDLMRFVSSSATRRVKCGQSVTCAPMEPGT